MWLYVFIINQFLLCLADNTAVEKGGRQRDQGDSGDNITAPNTNVSEVWVTLFHHLKGDHKQRRTKGPIDRNKRKKEKTDSSFSVCLWSSLFRTDVWKLPKHSFECKFGSCLNTAVSAAILCWADCFLTSWTMPACTAWMSVMSWATLSALGKGWNQHGCALRSSDSKQARTSVELDNTDRTTNSLHV